MAKDQSNHRVVIFKWFQFGQVQNLIDKEVNDPRHWFNKKKRGGESPPPGTFPGAFKNKRTMMVLYRSPEY